MLVVFGRGKYTDILGCSINRSSRGEVVSGSAWDLVKQGGGVMSHSLLVSIVVVVAKQQVGVVGIEVEDETASPADVVLTFLFRDRLRWFGFVLVVLVMVGG